MNLKPTFQMQLLYLYLLSYQSVDLKSEEQLMDQLEVQVEVFPLENLTTAPTPQVSSESMALFGMFVNSYEALVVGELKGKGMT